MIHTTPQSVVITLRRIRQQFKNGLFFSIMRNLLRWSSVAAVLIAVFAIGSPSEKLNTTRSAAHYETATLAGGCFWGLQETLRDIPGVIRTKVGYTGGSVPNPTYEMVVSGATGHTEAVEVVFDPARLTYEQLLTDFLTLHDPTGQVTRAANSHRSAIFYHSEDQRQIAERVKEKIDRSGKWNAPITTEIAKATKFYPAEEYHQDYFQKHRVARSCAKF